MIPRTRHFVWKKFRKERCYAAYVFHPNWKESFHVSVIRYIRIAYSIVVTSRHFVSSVKTGEKLRIYERNEQFPRHTYRIYRWQVDRGETKFLTASWMPWQLLFLTFTSQAIKSIVTYVRLEFELTAMVFTVCFRQGMRSSKPDPFHWCAS